MGLRKPGVVTVESALAALCQCNLEPSSSSPHPHSSLYQEMAKPLFQSVTHPHAPSPARVPFLRCLQVSQPRPLFIFSCCHLRLSAQCLCPPGHCYSPKQIPSHHSLAKIVLRKIDQKKNQTKLKITDIKNK